MSTTDERYCLLVDWFDAHAQLTRQYQLFYYPSDESIEMYDIKQRRTFLKRTKSDLKLQDLHIGAAVLVFSRQLVIRDYGDEYTSNKLSRQMERALVIIKPHAMGAMGEIVDSLLQNQFVVCKMRLLDLSRRAAEDIVMHSHGAEPYFNDMVASMHGGRSLAIEVMKANAIFDLSMLAGPLLTGDAKSKNPYSIRGKYGQQGYKNAIHVSPSLAIANDELKLVFGDREKTINGIRTAVFKDSTLAIIKPHAVHAGLSGKVMASILHAGFQITDCEIFNLDKVNAEEFLEVYKGVVPEYHLMLEQLTSGPLIAMEITRNDLAGTNSTVVAVFRDFVGPIDPELGRQLRPKSLRALYGTDKVKNAVHCTDLEEDGPLEVQFFFRIMVNYL